MRIECGNRIDIGSVLVLCCIKDRGHEGTCTPDPVILNKYGYRLDEREQIVRKSKNL